MAGKYGVDYSEFSELVKKVEMLGMSVDEVADKALEEAAPEAVKIYKREVPYDDLLKDDIHARDNVRASKSQTGKNGRYKLVGVFTENGVGRDWSIGRYLFYVEHGTSKMPANAFMKKIESAIQAEVKPIMKARIEAEIKARLGG